MSLFCFCCNTIHAQSEIQEEIIRQSVVFLGLQKKIPNEIKVNMKDILILNQGANFTFGKDLSVDDKSVLLISEQELTNKKGNGYFVFDTLTTEGIKATSIYKFVYLKDNKEIAVSVRLTLEKSANKWGIVNAIID